MKHTTNLLLDTTSKTNLFINVLRGESNMPNHCHNRVTVYAPTMGAEARAHVAKIKQIFEDENCFGQIIPEPDWANTPLMSSDHKSFGTPRGTLGELPQYLSLIHI